MAHDAASATERREPADPGFTEYDIVLEPMSHPGLGDIRIDENLFAIGRNEPPFESYAPEVVADLSRRHARIFCEYGAVYIADLDSKNGTTVNGVNIQQKISRLHHGDEIRFGKTISYRVHLGTRVRTQRHQVKISSLTLTPEHEELGLQPIIITQFPFLISKADDAFSRYKEEFPHQVHYLSRRHAHIFIKGSLPFLEDLGSTNGTFVNGNRLDEHAVPLKDGDTVGFGGHHFVYEVSLQKTEAELDPTVTKLSSAVQSPRPQTADADKTTFVAAADSFLDIFCVDESQKQEEEQAGEEVQQDAAAKKSPDKSRKRGKLAIMMSELSQAFSGSEHGEHKKTRYARWWGPAAVALLAIAGAALYFNRGTEEEVRDLLARGEAERAAIVAHQSLARQPDNTELQSLGTEAALKAYVPQWLAMLKARDFGRAGATLTAMKRNGEGNTDLQPLIRELEWIGNLEQFVMGRGGVDAPIRIYADEDRIRALLKYWNEDTQAHQRALGRIASYVAEFKDPYAEALSHLRKLQSDDAVYSAAIERLKSGISTELNNDKPDVIEGMLKEYEEKYLRLGGLDAVRKDLRQYVDIDSNVRARNLGPLVAGLQKARFSTPPFQAKFRALSSSGRLPSEDVRQQYAAVSKAWHQGDSRQALAGLQKLAGGPWTEGVAREMEHKNAVVTQFAALQQARGSKGYDERLASFYGLIDPEEDAYFMRATAPDLAQNRDKLLKRAQESMGRADTQWRQYRDTGGIDNDQRLETSISAKFRNQARLLSAAQEDAREGIRTNKLLGTDTPAQWSRLQEDINTEQEQQRRLLTDLRGVLDPAVLKSKLALVGGQRDERSSKTAH